MTTTPVTLMEQETREAPSVAARLVAHASEPLSQLGARLRMLAPRFAVAVGRGSSGAAAFLAKHLVEQRLGVTTASATPSLQSVYGSRLELEQALVLAISQSGRSPDLVDFCRAAAGERVLRVGFINAPSTPLHAAVDVALNLDAGVESSVAATKSCLAAILMSIGLVAHWRDDVAMLSAFARSADVLARSLDAPPTGLAQFLAGDGSLFVIGRGPGLAIAKEAALKLKETCAIHAEAISAAELRHGPLALAGPELRALVFAQHDPAFEGLTAVAEELRRLGCRVFVLVGDTGEPEPVLQLMGLLAQFYLAANAAALARNRSPDHPPLLSKVTETR